MPVATGPPHCRGFWEHSLSVIEIGCYEIKACVNASFTTSADINRLENVMAQKVCRRHNI